ncbi:MAG: ribonuclease P protein component [Ferrimicrobium sp.]
MAGDSRCRVGRVTNRREFGAFRESGRRIVGASLVSVWVDTGEEFVCLATATSRKTGSAVERNQFRRRVREGIRLNLAAMVPGNYLIIPRRRCSDISFADILADLTRLPLALKEGMATPGSVVGKY